MTTPDLHPVGSHPQDAEKIVMVLEILSGGELFDRIVKKGHYSERDASQLTSVIVKALGALHSVGILHRWVPACALRPTLPFSSTVPFQKTTI